VRRRKSSWIVGCPSSVVAGLTSRIFANTILDHANIKATEFHEPPSVLERSTEQVGELKSADEL